MSDESVFAETDAEIDKKLKQQILLRKVGKVFAGVLVFLAVYFLIIHPLFLKKHETKKDTDNVELFSSPLQLEVTSGSQIYYKMPHSKFCNDPERLVVTNAKWIPEKQSGECATLDVTKTIQDTIIPTGKGTDDSVVIDTKSLVPQFGKDYCADNTKKTLTIEWECRRKR